MAQWEPSDTIEAVLETDEDGGFHVHVPALKGCHSWGATRAEARGHIREAIELWLESARELGCLAGGTEVAQTGEDKV